VKVVENFINPSSMWSLIIILKINKINMAGSEKHAGIASRASCPHSASYCSGCRRFKLSRALGCPQSHRKQWLFGSLGKLLPKNSILAASWAPFRSTRSGWSRIARHYWGIRCWSTLQLRIFHEAVESVKTLSVGDAYVQQFPNVFSPNYISHNYLGYY
jgi:hypothetical protein